MLEHLFGSKTRLKLMKVFFRDTNKFYFVRELTRIVDSQINAVRRELNVLLKVGLISEMTDQDKKTKKGGSSLRKYYALNTSCILYSELQALLIKDQSMGEEKFIRTLEEKTGNILLLLLTGRFTGDKRAPSDILIVSNSIKESVLDKLIKKYEKESGAEIKYTIFNSQEFEDRRHVMDKFLFSLFEAKHIKVVDRIGI